MGGGGGGGDEDGSRFIFAGYPSLSTHPVAVRPRPPSPMTGPGGGVQDRRPFVPFECFIAFSSITRQLTDFIPLLLISLANLDSPPPKKNDPPPRRAFIQSEKGSNYMAP